ncbi:BCL-6 corepressor-like isoform X2 [Anguilla rostrata]|uniref:BCL-6 corepressor-like isoform X2 n=1 Tax=Anguilla rostrata TaxID=7938 RepID=UPI0030D406DA
MLSATPLYGTLPNWMSNERVHIAGINEERKVPASDGEPQKKQLELRDGNHLIQGMVDAGASARMNSLVTLGMDRNGLLRDGLRVHGGMVYPGIQALAADKAREGAAVALGYDHIPDLHYKHDVSLEGRKPSNGYLGLYKSPPPGLPKPLLVPGGGGDSLGLDRRVGPAEKQSDLGLNGGSGYLRLPWVSPYPEAGMYPYLDTKYAALSMYKASFLSQPTPAYLPQHLAYQSLCAGAGGASAERLFYLPPYPPAPISSPLAPPLRIPTATVAPAALSPLVHCPEKGMQSLGPRIHHEHPAQASAFGQQLHHQTHGERSHCERLHGNRSHGERPHGDRSHGERPHVDRSHGERSHGERPHGDRSHGDRSQGERHHSDRSQSERPHGERPHGDRSHGERPHGDRSHGERPHGERSHGERPHGDRSQGERSHGDRSHSERPHGERSHSSSKPGRTPSSSGSSVPSDSSPSLLMQSPRTPARLSQPTTLPPPLIDSTLDFQKPLPRVVPPSSSSSSSPMMSHAFYMNTVVGVASEHSTPAPAPPPAMAASHKPKSREGSSERKGSGSGADRKSSKSPLERSQTDKPLDLSAKLGDFGAPPNGFPQQLEAMAKLRGHSPTARYGLPPSRELLKETLSSSSNSNQSPLTVSTSSKPLDRQDIISTLHSTWVVPSPGPTHNPAHSVEANQAQGPPPTVIKSRNLEQVTPQQRSSSCPRIGEPNGGPSSANPPPTGVITPTGRPASVSPLPNVNSEWPKPGSTLPEKAPTPNQPSSGKPQKPSQRPEVQEIAYKSQHPSHLENGHSAGHLYLPQNEAFLPPTLAYANRYLTYSVPDGMTLPHLPLPAKGPVYPHPVLLGSSSLYPAHLAAPKHGLPYGLPPAHGEFLTYHDSQKMVHPLMSPHLALDPNTGERPERRPRPQDKARRGAEPADTPQKAERAAPKPLPPGPKLQAKHPPQPPVAGRDRAAGCIVEPAREDTAHRDADRARLLSGRSEVSEGAELEEQGVPLPAAVARQPHVSPSRPVPHSPDRTPPDQTLRCARTSGDRSGETEAHGTRRYLEASMEGGIADPESQEEEDDEDDDYEGSNGSSRTWKSSLAKRIANSSGYVGDRFKYVTTELYADSSKLSREQRALQRAMLRFSELELKEREGGAVADGQQPMEAEWEGCPHIARLRGVALDDEAERDGVRSAPSGPCGGNRVPVLQRCGVLREHRDQGRPGQEEAGPGGAAARKRSHAHLEERQAGEGDWEMAVLQAKRSRLSGDVWPEGDSPPPPKHLLEEVKNLKVRIELTGLSLRTPGPPLPSHPFQDLWVGQVKASPGPPAGPPAPPPRKRPEPCRVRDPEQGLPAHGEEVDTLALLEKRQRLKEQHRGGVIEVTSLEEAGPDGDSAPRLHRHGDLEKPKGKRQCKTKHISLRDRPQTGPSAEESADPQPDPEQKVCSEQASLAGPASPSDYYSPPAKPLPPSPSPAAPHTPLQKLTPQPSPPPAGNPPADTPVSRPMPPEARRLIVNKNAGETLLQRAARLGYEEVVLYCLENKVCDVNHRDNAGYCALHEACARGWLSIVQHLIEHGADINCSAQDGTRPLHDAVENDHLDVVRLLLSYGADPTLATYSGRGLLKMTHSDLMESFLTDYFADLQGRPDDDPGLCWDFYGSSVCEPADDPTAFDMLANPPGPGPDLQEQREVFEFEFSDRPLLPCYNIQVSLSQGPRNWLLLSDVLRRLRMSPAAFRAAFPHIDVVTVAEAEFYRQASLSQLFSCPEELEGFTPDSKELLDLVEISAELATRLGSSLECLDNHWDPVAVERS